MQFSELILEYVPAGHGEHIEELSGENVPYGQLEQNPWPPRENVPPVHG